jgi:predicted regulator of Ras-like GTPase activity (Roadblock/LC7/MglB family)
MDNVQDVLAQVLNIDGAIGAVLVDFASGLCLGARGGGAIDMELAGAAATELVRSQKQVLDDMGLDPTLHEMVVELNEQHHIIQGLEGHDGLFSYLILDKNTSSLPLARTQLRAIELEGAVDRP